MRSIARLCLPLLLLPGLAVAAPKKPAPAPAQREIQHLLDYLGHSRCQFERNGRWHGPAEARGHLERKLRHARKQDAGLSAETFIAHAASASSLSGKPYRVRCPGQDVVASGDWFRAELERFRAEH